MTDLELIKSQLVSQHPIHGMLGRVFERLGGEDFLVEWAEDHTNEFVKLFVNTCTPTVQPQQGVQGDLNITINEALLPTALDSVTVNELGEVIDAK